MPISTMPHYAPTPPSQPLDLWMAWREIRSASGILSLLTPSSLPPTSRSLSHLLWVPLSWLTIRTTRTSNLLQHPLPSPPLSSLYNKTFNSLCRRSLVTKTNFSLSLDCLLFVLCFVCLLLCCVFGSCFASVSESRILRAV